MSDTFQRLQSRQITSGILRAFWACNQLCDNRHAQHALYVDESTTLSNMFSSIISILLNKGQKNQGSAALLCLLLDLWINPSYDSKTPSTASLWIGKASTSLNLSLSWWVSLLWKSWQYKTIRSIRFCTKFRSKCICWKLWKVWGFGQKASLRLLGW